MTRAAVGTALAALCVLAACRDGDALVAPATRSAQAEPAPPRDAAIPTTIDPSVAQRCDEPCLFLVDTPLDEHAEAYRAACGKPLVPDNADCGKLDYWRNCIYAAHGFRFKSTKWKIYASKPWYRPRAEFLNRELSMLERANVHELRLRARACRHHDVHVSTTDFARIQAWFERSRKGEAEIPTIAVSGEDLVKATELRAALATPRLALQKDTWMAYHDPEASVVAALPGRKLRDAIVDLSNGDDDGRYLHFVFDEHDALVALVLTDH